MSSGESKNNLLKSRYFAAYRKKKKNYAYHPESVARFSNVKKTSFSVFAYSDNRFDSRKFDRVSALVDFLNKEKTGSKENTVYWIDMAGLNIEALQVLGNYFQIQSLLISDILSYGQRAKADDMGNQLFALLPLLAYSPESDMVETDQICALLLDGFVLSFHNSPTPEYFEQIEEKIKHKDAPARNYNADYLMYLLLDTVVDHYFTITDFLSEELDKMEDLVIDRPQKSVLLSLTLLRHKIMVIKRAITPVRELINNFWRSDNSLITTSNKKYFKDIYDHIMLAVEYNENYREMVINLQELYMNQVNTKMNEVMKILTLITALLAPFTIISGIYGMNFNRIPFADKPHGFLVAIICMLAVSALMLVFFRKKGWV